LRPIPHATVFKPHNPTLPTVQFTARLLHLCALPFPISPNILGRKSLK
jgi:hypothetical protein